MATTGRNLMRLWHPNYDPVVLVTTAGARAATLVQGSGGPNPGANLLDDSTCYLREGATLYQPTNNWRYTVESASGSAVVTKQKTVATTSLGNSPWYTSIQDAGFPVGWMPDPMPYPTDRSRGGGVLIPDALHFIYLSVVDDAGNPDYYAYWDTLVPDKGVHPCTRDPVIGSFKTGPDAGHMIDDLPGRVRRLEGALRAGRSSSSISQDFRLADLVARFYALEQWAGRVGTNSPPTPGSNAAYTESDLLNVGDPG